MELLINAWLGWSQYIDEGKYAVLLLGSLLFLWARFQAGRKGKLNDELNPRLIIFATLITASVICPLTAAVLMLYQTRFYDYIWLWTIVPVTLTIAYGGTLFYQSCYNRYWKGKILKPTAVGLCGLALLLLCGNLGGSQSTPAGFTGLSGSRQNHLDERTQEILDELTEIGNNTDICLWAPKELLENVRAVNGGVRLLYGRDMWEKSLGGYSYDVYDEKTVMMYEFMESLASEGVTEPGEEETEPLKEGTEPLEIGDTQWEQAYDLAEEALSRGVNIIILPESSPAEVVSAIGEKYDRQAWGADDGQNWAGYQLFTR